MLEAPHITPMWTTRWIVQLMTILAGFTLCGPAWCETPGAVKYSLEEEAIAEPPPVSADYVQYGVGLATQSIASAGDVCPSGADAPCILGSGAGLTIRAGYRTRGHWYVGGAYDLSRQDSSNILRLPILQQLRAEARYEMSRSTRASPYFAFGAGAVAYGNEWAIETAGFSPMIGAGLQFQLSRASLVGAALSYRPMFLRSWTDTAGELRADRFLGFGLAHLVTMELTFEVRSSLSRW